MILIVLLSLINNILLSLISYVLNKKWKKSSLSQKKKITERISFDYKNILKVYPNLNGTSIIIVYKQCIT